MWITKILWVIPDKFFIVFSKQKKMFSSEGDLDQRNWILH